MNSRSIVIQDTQHYYKSAITLEAQKLTGAPSGD